MQSPSENEIRQIYHHALRTVLVRIMLADGAATESEITRLVSVWQQITQESINKDVARAWCRDVEQDRIPIETHIRALAATANDTGKSLAFKAAFVLSISDGALQKSEIDLLNQMAAHFQFTNERVGALIQELKTVPNKSISFPHRSQTRGNSIRGWLIALFIIAIVGYSAIRYFIDRSNYNNGHQAYQQADCVTAINHFDNIIKGWRLFNIGGYPALAQQEKTECLAFQQAFDKQQAGDLDGALVEYTNFVTGYSNCSLAETARNRISSLFEQTKPSKLASRESCDKINTLLNRDLIPQSDVYLPPFYFACGQAYETADDQQSSYAVYVSLLTEYPSYSLAKEAEKSLLANPVSCKNTTSLQKNFTISNRKDFMPTLYYRCGQVYDTANNQQSSFAVYVSLLTEYPNHSLADKAETSLLANPMSCKNTTSLQMNYTISNRKDFMPTLYYNCGQLYEDDRDWEKAITMYEDFLADFPNHSFASTVEEALARSIVAQAKVAGAGEIPTPERSGSTTEGITEVVIQNDSPERLRITFSGPEARVEELGACSSCTTYKSIGPLFCPEKGPVGRYTLKPGQYDVVVESISDRGVTPWAGDWTLSSGSEYNSCFFIVSTIFP